MPKSDNPDEMDQFFERYKLPKKKTSRRKTKKKKQTI